MIRSCEEFPTSGFRPPKNKKGERTIQARLFYDFSVSENADIDAFA